jgi:hypothetical protein
VKDATFDDLLFQLIFYLGYSLLYFYSFFN